MEVNFTIESSPSDIANALSELGLSIEKTALAAMRETLERIQRRMKEPGKDITYPVKWDSEKQRRAFFATNGFGRGIPTKRTNAYVDSWYIRAASDSLLLSNSAKGAPYISGGDTGYMQSNIHKGRWNVLTEVADSELQNLNDEVYASLEALERQKGF